MQAILFCSDLMVYSQVSPVAGKHGYSMVSVSTMASLQATISSDRCRLVILDLTTRDLDVARALESIHALAPQAQVWGFGPHVQTERLLSATAAGCDEVFSRGCFINQLDQLLAQPLVTEGT